MRDAVMAGHAFLDAPVVSEKFSVIACKYNDRIVV